VSPSCQLYDQQQILIRATPICASRNGRVPIIVEGLQFVEQLAFKQIGLAG
jgi:hypothetical protein